MNDRGETNEPQKVLIHGQHDAARCILLARQLAAQVGFDTVGQTRFATAASELAQNVVRYAQHGSMQLRRLERAGKPGIEAIVEDEGPGIESIERVMQERVSTGGSLGLGLPGTRRMMDDFELHSAPGEGTRVTIRLWLQP
ncbi:MAG: ATP-binding protein [Myxococcales bacterium]|nr:ATP-binding protein [Myxococcales bacterium]